MSDEEKLINQIIRLLQACQIYLAGVLLWHGVGLWGYGVDTHPCLRAGSSHALKTSSTCMPLTFTAQSSSLSKTLGNKNMKIARILAFKNWPSPGGRRPPVKYITNSCARPVVSLGARREEGLLAWRQCAAWRGRRPRRQVALISALPLRSLDLPPR